MTPTSKTLLPPSKPSGGKKAVAEIAKSERLPYGLISITLGDLLRERLDEVVRSSETNRSQIIRDALESYLEKAPELEKARRHRREEVRKRAYLVALARLLSSIHPLLESFDNIDQADSLAHDAASLHRRVMSRLPEGLQPNDELKVPAIEDDLHDFERSSLRLWRAFGSDEWTKVVRRWQKEGEREETDES